MSSSSDPGRRAIEEAWEHLEQEELAEAAAAFERAIESGLEQRLRCSTLRSLGIALVQLGRFDRAKEVLSAVTEEFPEEREVRTMFVGLARTMEKDAYVRAFDFPFLVDAEPVKRRAWAPSVGYDHQTALGAPPKPRAQVDPRPVETKEALAVRPQWGADESEEWARGLDPAEITVGRAKANDVVIMHPHVSKMHAVFRPRDGRWELADVGSKNGTFVDQRRLSPADPPATIESGAYVSFGEASFLFFSAGDLWEYLNRK